MKYLFSLPIAILTFLFLSSQAHAIADPLASPNNKFGIHITTEADLVDAANLVNSSGGDWGYTTFVIRQDQMDPQVWKSFFSRAKSLHLIPIVRIAGESQDGLWSKLDPTLAQDWANFLNLLEWPIQNRYVIIGNEPNHSKEWGGEISPTGYAQILETYIETLKETNKDFFILPAGLDASAPDSNLTMEEEKFIKAINEPVPG